MSVFGVALTLTVTVLFGIETTVAVVDVLVAPVNVITAFVA